MIGRILGKRYEIVEKVGEGGMGLVYKARCHLLNRYVAVKILKPELTEDEEFINKFKKESLSSASLSHPNIVNIYDVGFEDGIYYIVMEYVKGKTLKEIIRERAPLSHYEIINITRQICLGLEHAHSNNIIHRDIKPHNILITHDGIVKVADFGIARASSSATLTNTSSVIGSVYYLSPEQARGGYTDEKTDIYSLGAVMFEMATGKVPFVGESPVAVALKHIQETVAKPSTINPSIPAALEDIILQSLEKNPAFRYESAAAMIKDLDRASQNPNTHIQKNRDPAEDITRVLPIIRDNDIRENTHEKKRERSEKKSSKGWIIGTIVMLLIIIAGSFGIYMLTAANKGKDIPVPNLIGQDENTAEEMLRENSLVMDVTSRPASDKPEGTVIKTLPETGMMVKKNSTVKVWISAGPEKVLVQNVAGEYLTDAQLILDQQGLKVNVIEKNDEKVEIDRVIKQVPDSGTEVVIGTTIDLYVSKGPEIKLVPVPSLIGISFDKVPGILEQYSLKIGNVDYKSDDTQPNNVVLEQSIAKDTEVREGQAIDIVVNKIVSPSPTVVPSPTPTVAPTATPVPSPTPEE